MRCLFTIQGEGRGHLTQALALQDLLAEAGHEVCAALVGHSEERPVPAFFRERLRAPITSMPSPTFVADAQRRAVHPWRSLQRGLRRLPMLYRTLDAIGTCIDRHRPDVVINFYEPLTGAYMLRDRPAVPMVSIAHQYMFLHPAYRFPPGRRLHRWGVQAFTHLTAARAAACLALSLYPAPAHGRLQVLPPLLRRAVLNAPQRTAEPFYLVYIVNSGYAQEIIRWHERHPAVPLHCFWDRPAAPATDRYDATLTFHRLDDRRFIDLMTRCKGLVCTAGFESIAEAMYLGKPVQVVPVEGHYEQWCNAFDTVRAGAGIRSTHFAPAHPERLCAAGRSHQNTFRTWVQRHRTRYVACIEQAVASFLE
ncbi:glycosyltransferase family protein [Salisaeta longa]|uniref:glycosyltransferase family protein n=1 Tax=Salisaeta longa TaxID=503170 RepID=UPI0003B6792C|nr:glycosyltransferase family protein [Salisaeta longa]